MLPNKLKHNFGRLLTTVMVFSMLLMLAKTPTEVKAEGDVSISDSIIIINPFIFYDFEYEPNFRTMQILDVITFRNVHSLWMSKADYRPELYNEVDNQQEFKLADIKEYRYFFEEDKPRDPVTTVDGEGDYSSKLFNLIDANIMTRDTLFLIGAEGCSIYKDVIQYTDIDARSEYYSTTPFKDTTIFEALPESVLDGRPYEEGDIEEILEEKDKGQEATKEDRGQENEENVETENN